MTYRKKLIEVALPLDAINKASIREKSIRHGHPSTLHLWWARRPLAACRAVLFASLVDDPSSRPDEFPTEEAQNQERLRLFKLIEDLVLWENSNNEQVLAAARKEIAQSTDGNPPPVLDPFAGGGSIPLEAQRLGLEAHASDLNPVAVLINKALIEIPPKFAGRPPVNPEAKQSLMGRDWHGAQGLADDIRYYGKWMRDEAQKRIGHLYPKVTLPKEYGGGEATVIAWLWTRTVKCPNPACGTQMPLARSFWLSKKKGKEAWVEPIIDHNVTPPVISFSIKTGRGEPQSGTVNRQGAVCLACAMPASADYIRAEGKTGRMNAQLMAIVVEGKSGRIYLPPTSEQEKIATQVKPDYWPEQEMPKNPRWFSPPLYGMFTFADLFTSRQLVALTTFSNLIQDAREQVLTHAVAASFPSDGRFINNGSTEATAYADAVATYLAFAVSRGANYWSSICSWHSGRDGVTSTFGRQALPMVWDFAEANPFSESSGNFQSAADWGAGVIERASYSIWGKAKQHDATTSVNGVIHPLISTDPPYYDNIGYADLSDFFYIWLRRSLNKLYPDLFNTLLVPKAQELIAVPYRFGGNKGKARRFFEDGLGQAFAHMREIQNVSYPLTVYYAFKQSESDTEVEDDGNSNSSAIIASTGWETMLEGLIKTGFTITGTWPMRTELVGNLKKDIGALASSIVLVCRPRPIEAPIASRKVFMNALRSELPAALKNLQRGNIAPVDLAQASIGPGMAIYSRYSKVVESDGTRLGVRTALQLINRTLDEVLAEQEGEYDAETRWAIAWFEQFEMKEGAYGIAETLSKAKNTTVSSLVDAGFLEAKGGKVRLLRRNELAEGWNPKHATRLTVWEVMQRLIFALDKKGEVETATILRQSGEQGEVARDLAYRLYTVCERKGWTQEALAYNSLVLSWSEVGKLARRESGEVVQGTFLV
ncbi:MAG TPA: DUF1156 domain-containing protein [Ktedonobacteraceae bacterium]|nr:DUF1156 domain-containing protein [Ktedonobacteraceae bacterium]